MRRFPAILLALLMLSGCCAPAEDKAPVFPGDVSSACEGPGYATPDEAVRAYVEALNAGDIDAMLATFAVEHVVEHRDPASVLSCYGMAGTGAYYGIPIVDPLIRGALIEQRRSEVTRSIFSFWMYQATLGTAYEEAATVGNVRLPDESAQQEFLAALKAEPFVWWLGHIGVIEIYAPEDPEVRDFADSLSVNISSENLQKVHARQVTLTGSDECTERIAVLDVDGIAGVQFMTCIRYGDRWYNYQTQSVVSMMMQLPACANGFIMLESGE